MKKCKSIKQDGDDTGALDTPNTSESNKWLIIKHL